MLDLGRVHHGCSGGLPGIRVSPVAWWECGTQEAVCEGLSEYMVSPSDELFGQQGFLVTPEALWQLLPQSMCVLCA